MDYQNLDVLARDGITTVTVTRPVARNALSGQTLTELRHLLDNLTTALILTGAEGLALAADFVYATGKSVFGQPEVRLGLIPGFGGCVRLQQQVGPARARELIYSGRPVDATEA